MSVVNDLRVDVLGVQVNAVSKADVVPAVSRWVDEETRTYVCVTGVHGVMESQSDPDLIGIHNESGLTVPDGKPMVWAGRFAGDRRIERVTGPPMMIDICREAARQGWRSFLYGGGDGTAELLAESLRERFPEIDICGTYTPPFRELTAEEDEAVIDMIEDSGAQLVWVGLSTPKQERWMADHVDRLRRPCVLFGVGAAFDVNAGLVKQAPDWVGEAGLNWLYRLLQEPRRLWRRYLYNNPRFLWGVLRRRPSLVRSGTSE